MRKIEFATSKLKICLEVNRDVDDGETQLSLSAKAIKDFDVQLTEAFKAAMMQAMSDGITPRRIELTGTFTISGTKEVRK